MNRILGSRLSMLWSMKWAMRWAMKCAMRFSLRHSLQLMLMAPLVTVIIFLGVLPKANAAEDEFPGRDLYPSVPYIEIKELHDRLDEVVVVDVRSSYEYETLRVKGALNVHIFQHLRIGDAQTA